MIIIHIDLPDLDGAPFSLRADGHAGAGPAGHDPVCAAVSIILQSMAVWLRGFPSVHVTHDVVETGRMEMDAVVTDAYEDGEHQLAWMRLSVWMRLSAWCFSLVLLAHDYPDMVRLSGNAFPRDASE